MRRKDGGSGLSIFPLEQAEWVTSPGPAPSERLEQDDLARRARACLADLPPIFREVVQLAILDEMDEEEIATLLCVAKGTVKSRKHRGLRLLKSASLMRIKENTTP